MPGLRWYPRRVVSIGPRSGALQRKRLGRLTALLPRDVARPCPVMFVEPEELGEVLSFRPVGLSPSSRCKVLIVPEYLITAHVRRPRVDGRRIGLPVDDSELVVHEDRWIGRRVVTREDVHLPVELGRHVVAAEELRANGVLAFAIDLVESDGGDSIGRNLRLPPSGSSWARSAVCDSPATSSCRRRRPRNTHREAGRRWG